MKALLSAIVVVGALLQSAPATQTFSGVITDSECADGDHSAMRMGSTAAECAKACVDYHGATLVLFDGKRPLRLDNQTLATSFAGGRVVVVGTLDEKAGQIAVHTIEAAK